MSDDNDKYQRYAPAYAAWARPLYPDEPPHPTTDPDLMLHRFYEVARVLAEVSMPRGPLSIGLSVEDVALLDGITLIARCRVKERDTGEPADFLTMREIRLPGHPVRLPAPRSRRCATRVRA